MAALETEKEWEAAHPAHLPSLSFRRSAKAAASSVRAVKAKDCRHFLSGWLPIVRWLPKYKPREYLFNDCLAGVTNGIMNIPQGMAYGMLAGLDPAHGLYTSFFLPLLYTFFGTSKHVAMGTFAIVSLMNGQAVDALVAKYTLSDGANATAAAAGPANVSALYSWFCGAAEANRTDLQLAFDISAALTLTMGLVQISLSLLRMGFLAVLLSDQLVQGLTSGAALYVMTVQVKHLLGIEALKRPTGVLGLLKFYVCCFIHIGEANIATVLTSFLCIAFLVLVKEVIDPRTRPKIKIPIPGELIVVVGATAVYSLAGLGDKYSVSTVGHIPRGLEAPQVPRMELYALDCLAPAVTIAVVLFSIECSLAKLFAKKHDYEIEPNQEFFALGATHAIAAFFGCHCGGSSLSRSMIQSNQGAKSQVPSLIAASIVLCVLYLAAPLFTDLPKCVLASIIVVALKGMYKQIGNLRPLWSQSKVDFAIWLVTFGSVLVLGITYGLMAGLLFSLLTIVVRSVRPDWALLASPSGGPTSPSAEAIAEPWRESWAWPSLRPPASVRVFRFHGPLHYANAELFRDALYEEAGVWPVKLRKEARRAAKRQAKEGSAEGKALKVEAEASEVRAVVVDCGGLSFVDVVGTEALRRLKADLQSVHIRLFLAGCHAVHLKMFRDNELFKDLARCDMFLDVPSAVRHASGLGPPSPSTLTNSTQRTKVL